MIVFVRVVGWVAFVAGVASIGLAFVSPDGLAIDTILKLCALLLVTGALLIGLAELLGMASKIQENTGWFAVSRPGPEKSQPRNDDLPENPAQSTRDNEMLPEVEGQSPASMADILPPSSGNSRSAGAVADGPELYDASRHPAAVEEWSHDGRRVMTLEDGTLATEVDGAWYRFVRLEEIEALGR